MKVTLQLASIEDIDAFLALEKSVAELRVYSAITTRKEAEEEFKKCTIYFIKIDEEIVGSISYEMKSPDHAYLSGLVVKPEFQGKGIGRFALVQILEKLKDIKRIDLVTHPNNVRAISLYTSLGFKIESRKENYYDDGEPRAVFSLLK